MVRETTILALAHFNDGVATPLSVRHPAWFGFGVVFVAVVGTCIAISLGFYGGDCIASGRRRRTGYIMLTMGVILFLAGLADVPIAWLLGLVE